MLEKLTDKLFQYEIDHVWRCHLYTRQTGRNGEAETCLSDVKHMMEEYRKLYPQSRKYEIVEGQLLKDGEIIK